MAELLLDWKWVLLQLLLAPLPWEHYDRPTSSQMVETGYLASSVLPIVRKVAAVIIR